MFNMFNGGKPDPMSMWIAQTEMDKEERQKKLKKQKRREFWKKIIPLIKKV